MGEILDKFNEYLSLADGFLHTYILSILLIVVGLFYSFSTRFVQFRFLFHAFSVLTEKKDKFNKAQIGPFEALMISTASRVGIGNIAGISVAVVSGGAGALFWMWVMALVGGASAFVESTLAQVYKQKDGQHGFKGGPAYYIHQGLGIKWLGQLFAVFLIITYAYGFNGLQSQTMTSAFAIYFDNSSDYKLYIGVILAVFSAFMFFSKSSVIGKASSLIVPIMAFVYIGFAIIAIVINYEKIPDVFLMIFRSAFDFEAIFGGFMGSAIVIGIKRGLFSNEAGMGSAPNAAAAAHTSHPVKQGIIQSFSVFIDVIICTASGFLVLFSNSYLKYGLLDEKDPLHQTAMPLVQSAMVEYFGSFGLHFITFAIVLFAITSLIGNYFYAYANIKYLTKDKLIANIFKASAVLMVFIGSMLDIKLAWNLADFTMFFIAAINIVSIVALRKVLFKVLKDYEKQRKEGKNPVFHPEKLDIKNAKAWQR